MDPIPLPTRRLALALLCAAGCSDGASTGPEVTEAPCRLAVPACTSRVEIASDLYLRHYRTHDLNTGASRPTRALILVHGAGRNAEFNFNTGLQATLDELSDEVVVIAPHFITTEEDPLPDEPWWSEGGWKRGHLSRREGPSPRVSSYAALDTIVAHLSDRTRFPNIEEIVVAGHSAGGQVTHRYAAGGMPSRGVPIRYVVANPSTFLFLGPERPDGAGGWAIPSVDDCADYQEWHLGPEELNSYMSRLGPGAIEDNLLSRDVAILLGDADTGSAQLDVSCGANLQGPHRFARGTNLLSYMDLFHPSHSHSGTVVAGVGHSSRGVFLSEEGLAILLP